MLDAGTMDFCTMIGPLGQIRATTAGFLDVAPLHHLKAQHPSFLPFLLKISTCQLGAMQLANPQLFNHF